jgi:hypothetical protein
MERVEAFGTAENRRRRFARIGCQGAYGDVHRPVGRAAQRTAHIIQDGPFCLLAHVARNLFQFATYDVGCQCFRFRH